MHRTYLCTSQCQDSIIGGKTKHNWCIFGASEHSIMGKIWSIMCVCLVCRQDRYTRTIQVTLSLHLLLHTTSSVGCVMRLLGTALWRKKNGCTRWLPALISLCMCLLHMCVCTWEALWARVGLQQEHRIMWNVGVVGVLQKWSHFCQSTTLDPSLNMTVEMSIEGDKLVVGSLRGRFNLYGFRQTGNHFIKVHV